MADEEVIVETLEGQEMIPDPKGKGFTVLGPNTTPIMREAVKAIGKHLTVVETIYHHAHDGTNPLDVDSRYSIIVTSDQEPYDRTLKVGEEWIPLRDKHNWIEVGTPIAMLAVGNPNGKFPFVLPTEEERKAEEAKILELKYEGTDIPFTEIPVGQNCRFKPIDFEKIQIRCRAGKAKFDLSVFPLSDATS